MCSSDLNSNRLDQINPQYQPIYGTYTGSVWLRGSGTINIALTNTTGLNGNTEITITLTNTWTRYPVSTTFTGSTGNLRFMIVWRSSNTATSCYAWGTQVNAGASATTYLQTTSNLKTIYNPSGYLNEQSSVNLIFPSQSLSGWTANLTASFTDNALTSPDGGLTASQVTATSLNAGYFKTATVVRDRKSTRLNSSH